MNLRLVAGSLALAVAVTGALATSPSASSGAPPAGKSGERGTPVDQQAAVADRYPR